MSWHTFQEGKLNSAHFPSELRPSEPTLLRLGEKYSFFASAQCQ